MSDTQEQAYMCANVVAAAKEKEIKLAFDAFFERKDWTENDLREIELQMEVEIWSGTETMVVNGRHMVQFGRVECKVEIEGQMVQCLYNQSVERLYDTCGV